MTDGTDAADLCIAGLRFEGLSRALLAWEQAYSNLAEGFNSAAPARVRAVAVPLRQLFLGHGFHYFEASATTYDPYDPTLWLSEQDCIHPNNRGHHELRRIFYQAIRGDL